MSSVVISGYYGSKNGGDEAMLAAMLEVFADVDPKVNITVISSSPADTKERHGVETVHWLDLPAIFGVLKKSDLLISGGGSLLQDVTSRRSLYYYLAIIMLAMLSGTKVMLYAQGIGPIRGKMARRLMTWLGNKVDLITVRDNGSIHELEEMGIVVPRIIETADPVLAIHKGDVSIGKNILLTNGVEVNKPLVGISVREWCDLRHYKEVLAATADEISEMYNAEIVFLPMQYPDDVKAAELIAQKTHCGAIVLNSDFSTNELISIVGNMDLLIAVRLHALIFAGVMNIPMIGISYDPKIDRFLDSLGEKPVASIENIEVSDIMQVVAEKMKQKHEPQEKDTKLFARLRELAIENSRLAVNLIK